MTVYTETVSQLRAVFNSGRTLTQSWRMQQARNMLRMIDEEEARLLDALWKDLRKCKTEALGYEIKFARNEVMETINELDNWMRPQKVKKSLVTIADTAYTRPEPLGVCLVMGAWNYPIQLVLLPVMGAIAAGNCVVVKPSELSVHTAALLEELLPKYLDPECIKVINGGIPETTALLKERFDKIFYTGSSAVGKIVMEAAAKHLTPVTLELGGKSPVYVDPSSDMKMTARRIIWGKLANLGQTCVAPDYILCRSETQEKLLPELKAAITEFYGEEPQKSPDLGRMVNERHFNRVKNLIEKSGTIVHGGKSDAEDRYIDPTILINVKPTDPVMQDEIFGPVLPILTIEGVEDAIQFIRAREKPLALYLFCKDTSVSDNIIARTSSGGALVNDTMFHVAVCTLPFGGVGHSGMGQYHGKYSFDTFSHQRACLIRAQAMEGVNTLRYPPFTEKKSSWLTWAMESKERRGVWGAMKSWFS